jgi:murein L,D-transpeptidase YcbB/YkuD
LVLAALAMQPQLRLTVNIPAFRLDVLSGDSLVRTIPVAVGMPRFRTPRGSFTITSVEWNPWWIPPKSPWAAKEKKTPPGPDNPMGRVKINFADLYFLHGTPLPKTVGSAASHGCLRLKNEDAIDLARLVHRFGNAMEDDRIGRYVNDTATRWVKVDSTIPIDVKYELAEIRDGRVFVYRDVYRLATRPIDEDVLTLLERRGIDLAMVDSARIRDLVRRVGPAGNSAAIDSLMKRPPPTDDAIGGRRRRLGVQRQWLSLAPRCQP